MWVLLVAWRVLLAWNITGRHLVSTLRVLLLRWNITRWHLRWYLIASLRVLGLLLIGVTALGHRVPTCHLLLRISHSWYLLRITSCALHHHWLLLIHGLAHWLLLHIHNLRLSTNWHTCLHIPSLNQYLTCLLSLVVNGEL